MKSNTTKTPKTTNRANLEEKFDADQDVSDYFDFSQAVVWGGKRKGAGRKPLGKVRKQVLLSAAIIAKIDAIAKKRKQSFSAVLEDACGSFTKNDEGRAKSFPGGRGLADSALRG